MILLTDLAEMENCSVTITTGGAPGSAEESKPEDTPSTAARIASMSLSEGGGGGGSGGLAAAATSRAAVAATCDASTCSLVAETPAVATTPMIEDSPSAASVTVWMLTLPPG